MITELEIKNFKSIRLLKLKNLGRFNVIVGSNSSGKTSILEAIELGFQNGLSVNGFFKYSARNSIYIAEDKNIDYNSLMRKIFLNLDTTKEIEVNITYNQDKFTTVISKINNNINDHINNDEQKFLSQTINGDIQTLLLSLTGEFYEINKTYQTNKTNCEDHFLFNLNGVFLLNNSIAINKKINNNINSIGIISEYHNHSITDYLNKLIKTQLSQQLIELLQILEPNLKDITILDDDLHNRTPHVAIHGIPELIPFGCLGKGAKTILGLFANIINSDNQIFLFDEIEYSIHHTLLPKVIMKLYEIIQQEKKNHQIILVTHSADLPNAISKLYNDDPTIDIRVKHIQPHKDDNNHLIATDLDTKDINDFVKYNRDIR